ncbi:MAG: histone deacetylase [Thermodesulfobacteriota bacterium]
MTNPAKRTGIVKDPRYAQHCVDPGHPECPQRLAVLYTMLQEPGMRDNFQDIAPRNAETEAILQVHSKAYIQRLEATEGKACTYLDADTQTSPLSHEAALLSIGGLCRAIELVHAGELDTAFALVRPPGHHAERSRAKGFCLYNNVAVGVRYAQRRLGLGRVLVADWDLHFGNGTQHCFEEDPSVLYFSIHQVSTFPGGGKFRDVGKGGGKGFSINIPLLPGCGDGEYVALFEKILKPVALEFSPELILVSAGFDPHYNDPLGGMRVTPEGFAGMTRSILDMAEHCCHGKVVMTLEGGYDLEGLRDSVRAVLMELAGLQQSDTAAIVAAADPAKLKYVRWRVRRVLGKYWKSLQLSPEENRATAPSLSERLGETVARVLAYLNS